MADQIDNLMLDDDATGLPRTINVASDDIVLSVNLTLQSGGVITADNVKRGSSDPNSGAGTAGNEGDLYQQTGAGVGSLWYNTDGTATGWSQVVAVGGSGTGTDNHLVRWDGTHNIQDSGIVCDDSDNLTGVSSIALTDGSATRAILDVASNDFRARVYDTDGTTLRGTFSLDASTSSALRWDSFVDLNLDSSALITLGADSSGGADIRRRTATATNGGSMVLRGAATTLTNGTGGLTVVLGGTGDGTGPGGASQVQGGTGGASSGTGGLTRTLGGSGGAPDGTGGIGQVRGGTAGGGSGSGGQALVTGGTPGPTGAGGNTTVEGGPGGATSGAAGAVIVRGGNPIDGNGGGVTIQGRDAATTTASSRTGGAVTILGGAATVGGSGGSIQVSAGSSPSGTAGSITINAGTTTSGTAGSVSVTTAGTTRLTVSSTGLATFSANAWVQGTGTSLVVGPTGNIGLISPPIGGTPDVNSQVGTNVATNTVASSLYVNDGSRNTRVGFFLTDDVSGSGAWGQWLTHSSSGLQPYVIGAASTEWLRISTAGLVSIPVDGNALTLGAANSTSSVIVVRNTHTSGTPGQFTFRGGQSNTTTGGIVAMLGGTPGATATGGAAFVEGGPGGATSGAGGAATVRGGTATDGNGGAVTVQGRDAVGTNRTGGGITIIAGNATGSGTGGGVTIDGGNGGTSGTAGTVIVTAGAGASTNGTGAQATIRGGSGVGAGNGGVAVCRGGAAGATGIGGTALLEGGAGGSTSGTAGAVTIRGGSPTDGNGGSVTVQGRDAVGTNRSGGSVTITTGSPTGSGSAGTFIVSVAGTETIRSTSSTSFYLPGASPTAIHGDATGSPTFIAAKSDAGAYAFSYRAAGTANANRRWNHVFASNESLSWDRYDASGVLIDTPLALAWSDGSATFGGSVSLSSGSPILTVGNGTSAPTILTNGGAGTLYNVLLAQQNSVNVARLSVTSTGWFQFRQGGGTPVLDLDTATGGTISAYNTVFSHAADDADNRIGTGAGSPILRWLKSDAGALSVVYSVTNTTSANRRWSHQFNSSEHLTWNRYDGAGNVVDTPLTLSYTDGTVTFGASVTLGSASPILRHGLGTGSPVMQWSKSDAGTLDVSYRSGGASSTNQRWLHRFESTEDIFWARYDGSGVFVDTPLILSWTNGSATFAHDIVVDEVTYTGTDGTAGQFLTTDGAGTTSWTSVALLSDWKQSVRAATTGNITLSGEQTIDGVSVVAGDRVLVKNQSTVPTSISSGTAIGSSELVTDSNTFVSANCSSPPLASGDWFVIGHANFRNDGGTTWAAQIEARFGTTRIATASWYSIFGNFNTGDDAAGGAFQFFARITANDSDTVNLRAQAIDNGGGGSGENIRVGSQSLIWFSLDTLIENTDYWVAEAPNSDTAEVTPNGATWTNSEQLTFTPTESGDYLILASTEGFNTTGTTADEYWARLRMNGVTIGTETEMKVAVTDAGGGVSQFGPSFTMIDVRSLTASTEYSINWQFQNAVGENQLSYRRSRIYVFRLAAFGDSASTAIYDGIQATSGTVECTSDLTFDFGGSAVNTIVLAGCDYANAGAWGEGWLRHDGSPDVDYPPDGYMWAVVDGTLTTFGDFMPITFGAWESSVTGSQTYRLVGHSDDTPILTFGRNRGNTGNSRMVLVALAMSAVGDSTVAPGNGIYTVSAGAWSRSTDADTDAEVTSMLAVGVEEGTVNGNTVWCLTTPNPITLDDTSIGFSLLQGAPSSLAATLAVGSTTGGMPIVLTSGSSILGENSASATAGGITLTAGFHNGGGSSGYDGGDVAITAGDTDDTAGDGGNVVITAGSGNVLQGGIILRGPGIATGAASGSVSAYASNGSTSTGSVLIVGAGSNVGGSVALVAGDGVSGNTQGGNASISGGLSSGSSNAGNLNLTAGEAQGSGDGGSVFLAAGVSDSGSPGSVNIFGETFFFTGTPNAVHVNGAVVFPEFDNGSSGASITIDWGVSQKQVITLTASCTFSFTNPAGASSFTLRVIQGGTGGYTITWPGSSTVLWPGGTIVQPTATVGAETIYVLYFNGTRYYAQAALDFQ